MKRSLISLVTVLAISNPAYVRAQSAQPGTEMAEIVVSANPLPQELFGVSQPMTVVSSEELLLQSSQNLGQSLSSQVGVTGTGFGPGASRPVIRGQQSDRVRILENGIGTQDVSNTSPDHAVSEDGFFAERIEIVRGPATLMYGPNAVGGVVNAIDDRIPTMLPEKPISGSVQLRGSTVDDGRAGGVSLLAPIENFAFRIQSFARKTDDLRIPGFARTQDRRIEEPDLEYPEPQNKLPYSDTEAQGTTVGGTAFGDWGFFGLAGSYYNSEYGVPNGEENISIDMRQPRLDIHGRLESPFEFLKYLDVKSGLVNYKHTEFEGEEAGTVFKNRGSDTRVEAAHVPLFGSLEGVVGVQAQTSRFAAVGEEAFQPATASDIYSLYLFEQLPLSETVRVEAGVRGDFQQTDTDEFKVDEEIVALDRDFETFSQSTGVVWSPVDQWSFAISLAHTERAPSGQELFSNGPHVATAAYEVGDPDLDTERSIGVDVSARKRDGVVTGALGLFMNRFTDFISLLPTGEEDDELPVYAFTQQDAIFYGVESDIEFHLFGETEKERKVNDLTLRLQQDWVWAEDRRSDEPLPRIPPLRLTTGLDYRHQSFGAMVEVRRIFEQDRVVEFETSTGASTLLNAALSYDLEFQNVPAQLFVRGDNLTNEEVRNHVSFIKDVAPEAGRSILGGVRFTF